MMEFYFPLDPPQKINNKSQLLDFLSSMVEDVKLRSYCAFSIRQSGKYIYARCKQCLARLGYKKMADQQGYILDKLFSKHKHLEKLNLKGVIMQKIQQYPEFMPPPLIKAQILKIYQISESTFYRYLNQVRFAELSFNQLLSNLQQKNYKCAFSMSSQIDDLPDFLLVTSEQMKINFAKYGQFLSFDLTYNLIRQHTGPNQFSIGVFCGLDNCCRITTFGVAICSRETKDLFSQLFNEFFILVGGKPSSIFTDNQKALKFALEQLKQKRVWDGDHYLDSFHILRSIKKKLRDKDKITVFSSLISAENKKQFTKILQGSHQRFWLPSDAQILQEFVTNSNQYCFSEISGSNFIGFGIFTGISEKINDIIKSKIPVSKKYTIAAMKIFEICLATSKYRQVSYEKKKFEKIIPLPQIVNLRKVLSQKIFRKLLKQITLCMFSLIAPVTESEYIVRDSTDIDFNVQLNPESGEWICDCEYSIKTGIPCRHICKVKILTKENILSAISRRWLIPAEIHESLQTNQNYLIKYPRKSKRNRH